MDEIVAPEVPVKKKRGKRKGPKVIGLSALLSKKYSELEDLPEHIKRSFGVLPTNFIMMIWGQSGSGKSSFIYQFLSVMMDHGNVLYISLEEGTEKSAKLKALQYLNKERHSGKIGFADHTMTYDETVLWLKKKSSPQFIVIDSVQYWDIDYWKYKALKEMFPRKAFIFISHASGKNPDGKTADKIRYDAGIKLFLEGCVGFPKCRYGGNKPYIVYEGEDNTKGAWLYWGRKKLNQFKK